MNIKESIKIGFDRKEVAQKLGVSIVTIDRELSKNRIPHFRIGRRVLFTEAHLQEYIEKNSRAIKTKR